MSLLLTHLSAPATQGGWLQVSQRVTHDEASMGEQIFDVSVPTLSRKFDFQCVLRMATTLALVASFRSDEPMQCCELNVAWRRASFRGLRERAYRRCCRRWPCPLTHCPSTICRLLLQIHQRALRLPSFAEMEVTCQRLQHNQSQLQMPNVTPQPGALVLVHSDLPSSLEGGRLREDHFSGAQTCSRCVLSCAHHERCVNKKNAGMDGQICTSALASLLPSWWSGTCKALCTRHCIRILVRKADAHLQ